VTLLLAALGIWRLPTALTESLIALSIVLVAVHNLIEENPRGRAMTAPSSASSTASFRLGPRRIGSAAPRHRPHFAGVQISASSSLSFAIRADLLPAFGLGSADAVVSHALLVPGCCIMVGVAGVWFVKRAFGLAILPWLGS